MIITGKSRSDWRTCASRILREGKDESARAVEFFGLAGNDVGFAFRQLQLLSLDSRCENFFYHASINPRAHEVLTERQWQQAVDILARHLGFEDSPHLVVERIQNGRIHRQVVWSRIDLDTGKAISDAWSYRKHQRAAREIEDLFGLQAASRRRQRRSEREAVA